MHEVSKFVEIFGNDGGEEELVVSEGSGDGDGDQSRGQDVGGDGQ